MSEFVQITTTTNSEQSSKAIADILIQEQAAACVQVVGPVRSTYRWKEKVEREIEWLLLIKTTKAKFEDISKLIRKHHSYETPEIICQPITAGSGDYLDWINRQVK